MPCAARRPTYLARRGAPTTPEDLAQHECLTYTHVPVPNTWSFTSRDGQSHSVRIMPRHRANNGRMLAELAVAGMGVIFEPDFIVAPEVDAGRLVLLLPGYEPARGPIAAVYPSRRHLSAKVRGFVDFLAERFAAGQPWNQLTAGRELIQRRAAIRAGQGDALLAGPCGPWRSGIPSHRNKRARVKNRAVELPTMSSVGRGTPDEADR